MLEDYTSSLESGNTKKALEFLSKDLDRNPTEEELRDFVKNAGPSLDKILHEIASRKGVRMLWTMVLPDGLELVLVHEKNGWKILSGPIVPAWPLTAEQALVQFANAIQRGDCAAIKDFAPPEIRARYSSGKIEKACVQFLESLKITAKVIKENLKNIVYLTENKAQLPYGKNSKVILEKKGGRWFIEDL